MAHKHIHMTLGEKEALIRESVGVPSVEDWQLMIPDIELRARLIARLNEHLIQVLDHVKAGHYRRWEELAQAVYGPLEKLAREHPGAGLLDGEAHVVIARFFAVNYRPALYDFLRHYAPS